MRAQPIDFAIAVLDSLSAHIAVLDMDGLIVAVNQAWSRFSSCNGGEAGRSYVGTNYLQICERAAQAGDGIAKVVHAGIIDMCAGRTDELVLEYPCDSAEHERWFILRVTRCEYRSERYLIVSHDDITARKQAEAAVQRTEQTLRRVLEALPVGVWLMDRSGCIVHGNPAGRKIWAGSRYVGPENFGEYKGWWLSSGKPIAADEWAAARAIRNGETSIDEVIRIECFDGSSKIILNSAIPLRDPGDAITGAIIVNQDVTARMQAEDEMRHAKAAVDAANDELRRALAREQHAARTDELTGVFNRRHFFSLARQLFEVARRYQQPLSVVLFDVDHFKAINDRFGHEVGDLALKHLVGMTRPVLRDADVFARYGGEEFILMLPDTGPDAATLVADRIRLAVVESAVAGMAASLHVAISAGVAGMTTGDQTLSHLIRRADEALYVSKQSGRNRVSCAATKPG